MDQKTGPLDMSKEIMAKTVSFGSPLDQARNIRDDEARIADTDDTEHRFKGRKRIVCDLRFCGRDHGQKRGFSGIRESDKSHIRDKFQFDRHVLLFTRDTGSGKLRCLTDRVTEMNISLTAAATLADDLFLAGSCKIGDNLSGLQILHDRSDRHGDTEVFSTLAVHLTVHAVTSVFRDKLVLETEILKRR